MIVVSRGWTSQPWNNPTRHFTDYPCSGPKKQECKWRGNHRAGSEPDDLGVDNNKCWFGAWGNRVIFLVTILDRACLLFWTERCRVLLAMMAKLMPQGYVLCVVCSSLQTFNVWNPVIDTKQAKRMAKWREWRRKDGKESKSKRSKGKQELREYRVINPPASLDHLTPSSVFSPPQRHTHAKPKKNRDQIQNGKIGTRSAHVQNGPCQHRERMKTCMYL